MALIFGGIITKGKPSLKAFFKKIIISATDNIFRKLS
jgi:hypothetical protein